MDNLQKFSGYVKNIQSEVEGLEFKKDALTRDNRTLGQRNDFLIVEIKKLKDQKAKLGDDLAEIKQEIIALDEQSKLKIAVTKKDLITMQAEQNNKLNELQTALETTESDLAAVNNELSNKRSQIHELSQKKEELQTHVKALEAKLTEHKSKIDLLKLDVENAKTQADEDINSINIDVESAKSDLKTVKFTVNSNKTELAELQEKIKDAQVTLNDINAKHKEFLEYETRAQKMLIAKEDAIINREEDLEKTIVVARRRAGIVLRDI